MPRWHWSTAEEADIPLSWSNESSPFRSYALGRRESRELGESVESATSVPTSIDSSVAMQVGMLPARRHRIRKRAKLLWRYLQLLRGTHRFGFRPWGSRWRCSLAVACPAWPRVSGAAFSAAPARGLRLLPSARTSCSPRLRPTTARPVRQGWTSRTTARASRSGRVTTTSRSTSRVALATRWQSCIGARSPKRRGSARLRTAAWRWSTDSPGAFSSAHVVSPAP